MSGYAHKADDKDGAVDKGLQIRLGRAPREERQVVKYTFFALDPAWRRLPTAEREAQKAEFAEVVNACAQELILLRSYNLVGMHHDTDFMLWSVSATLEEQSALLSRIHAPALGAWLRVSFSSRVLREPALYAGR